MIQVVTTLCIIIIDYIIQKIYNLFDCFILKGRMMYLKRRIIGEKTIQARKVIIGERILLTGGIKCVSTCL